MSPTDMDQDQIKSPLLRSGMLTKKGARSGICTQRQVIATQSSLIYSQQARVSRSVPLLHAKVGYKTGSSEFSIVDIAKQKYIFRVPACKDTAALAASWANLLTQAASTLKCIRHGVLNVSTPGVDKCKERKVWLTQRCLVYEHTSIKKEGFAVVPLVSIELPIQRVPLERRLVLSPQGGKPTHVDFSGEAELQVWLSDLTNCIRGRQKLLLAKTKKTLTKRSSFRDSLKATASEDLERGVISRASYEKIVSKSPRRSSRASVKLKDNDARPNASCAVCLQHFSNKVKKVECSSCHRGICGACCTICPDICNGEQRRLCNVCLEAEQDNVIGGWDDSTWHSEVHPCIQDAIAAVTTSRSPRA